MGDKMEPLMTIEDLPVNFQVKYLGFRPCKGLWGIKHTRKPVDALVTAAKSLGPDKVLPYVKLQVSLDGLSFQYLNDEQVYSFGVDTISYGVQDLVYTRVFSMIVVKDESLKDGVPFVCHGFVCESRLQARRVTYALAAAFQEYGKRVKEENAGNPGKKRFAIDLRSPEDIERESEEETEA